MAKSIIYKGKGSAKEVAEKISNYLMSKGFTCDLNFKTYEEVNNVKIAFMMFEQYYYRVSNYLSLSVEVIEFNGVVKVSAASSGGSQGIIFKITWGAENNFIDKLKLCLNEMEFDLITEENS